MYGAHSGKAEACLLLYYSSSVRLHSEMKGPPFLGVTPDSLTGLPERLFPCISS